MKQETGVPQSDEEMTIKVSEPLLGREQLHSTKSSNRGVFIQGYALAIICVVLALTALDGGMLAHSAKFTVVAYFISTTMIWRRSMSGKLSLVDRLVVRVGFPVFLSILHILIACKSELIDRKVITWPGIF